MPLNGEAKRGSQRGRGGSAKEVLALRAKGMTLAEIGRHRGVSKQRIHAQLKALVDLADRNTLEEYRKRRTDFITAAEMRILRSMVNEPTIEKASLNNRAYAFAQLHQARRLEEDRSTVNLAIHQLVEAVEREDSANLSEPQDVVVEAQADRSTGSK